jgi:hypothetical protein
VDRPFALLIVSAGSGGTLVLGPVSVMSLSTVAAVAVSTVSPEEAESPLASLPFLDAPERELPAPFRDEDMMPLSTMVSMASPSGSAFGVGGAAMSGD